MAQAPGRIRPPGARRALQCQLVILLAGVLGTALANPAPLDVADRRQVFIDGRFFAAQDGVSLVVHPPEKTGEPTLDATFPKQTMISRHGTVLRQDGVYHMWYASFPRSRESWPAGETHDETESFPLNDFPCYARSSDGVHWEKPNLGVAPPYDGAEPNILPIQDEDGRPLAVGEIGMVFVDPNAPDAQRFRMVVRERDAAKKTDWLSVLSSADGRTWRRTHRNVLSYTTPKHHLDSPNVIFWDDRVGKYVAYVRRNLREQAAQGRTVARAESAELGNFAPADTLPVVLKWDALDPAAADPATGRPLTMVDFYNSSALKYPDADDAYFMFPSAYYHYHGEVHAEFAGDEPTNAGPNDIRFAASRDGISWQRFDRRPFVPLGARGEFDAMLLYLFRGVVPSPAGDEMYLYYSGSDRPHGWDRNVRNKRILRAAGLAPEIETSRVSRLVLRRDGFISARAQYAGGEFTTPLLTFRGSELVLNIDTSAAGMARVEIQDALGVPVPGFALEDAGIIHSANSINRVVKWKGSADVSSLAGRPVRLRFVMRDTDLYAFQFRTQSTGGK